MDGKIANRSEEITEEQWLEVNEFNRFIVNDFLDNQTHLSNRSVNAYRSALRIFFVWCKDNLQDKKCIDIKKKEFLRYINWLVKNAHRSFSLHASTLPPLSDLPVLPPLSFELST